MILYQKKVAPYFLRLLGAIFNPIILIFFVIPIAGLIYYALQGDISTSPVKGMWFGAGVLAFISAFMYYNRINHAITRLRLVELSPAGLKVQKVKYDTVAETIIPTKEIQLELKRYQNKNAKRSGEWHSHVLEFFDGTSIQPVFVLHEKQERLQEILEKIEQQNLIPLKAAEKDFLTLSRVPEKGGILKGYQKLNQKLKQIGSLGALIVTIYFGYMLVNYVLNSESVYESLVGTWRVHTPETTAGMLITLNSDSTASESVFNTPIKFKYKEGDGISNQPAVLTFSTENPGGWGGYDYSIINKTDSVIELKRSFDERLFQLIKSNEGAEEVTEFKKLIGILDHSFLMPVPIAIEDKLLNLYLLNWQPDQRPAQTLLRGERHVFLLDGYSGSYVAVFNLGNEALLSHKIFEGVQGECSNSFSKVTQNGVALILNEYRCIEGDPTLTYYRVAENGELVNVKEANKESSSQWALLESFKSFPGKWFPLFEGANGLERQQLCGDEGFIEIIETDNGNIWRELGYQDAWEGVIQNFEVVGVEVSSYQFFIKSEGGSLTEINVVHDEAHEGVMLFNGKPYTKQPELFPVNNNSSDCP